MIDQTSVTSTSLARWQAILGGSRENAVRFLVNYRWMRGEAVRRGVVVTRAELERAYRREVRSYSRSALRRLLRESGQTRANLRVRVNSLHYTQRLLDFAWQGVAPDQQTAARAAFYEEMRAYWQPLTRCIPAYFLAEVCGTSS